MRKIPPLPVVFILASLIIPQPAWADTAALELRLDALEQEVAQLKQELRLQKQQVAATAQLNEEIISEKKASVEKIFKSILPDWLNSMKIAGDLRMRYQYQRRDVPSGGLVLPRSNGKYRARLQFEDQINNMVKVIFGIATDGGNPRSNNVTFGGNTTGNDVFGKGFVVANKVYAIYTPAGYLTLKAGKMDNPIWEPTNILWDGDITPEGGVIELQKKLNDQITPFSTTGFFVLHDAAPTAALRQDPYLFFEQYGIKGNITKKLYYKAAGIYYNVHNPSNIVMSNSLGTNTILQGYGLRYNFNDIIGGTAEFGLNDPFGKLLPAGVKIPQVGVIGQYTQNMSPSHNNASWLIGGYIGSPAVNGWGTWRALTGYKVIERDAWLDSITDNDFYSGDTNTAGYRTQLDIGLAKNIWMTLTLFDTRVFKRFNSIITNTSGSTSTAFATRGDETQVQADLNFKF